MVQPACMTDVGVMVCDIGAAGYHEDPAQSVADEEFGAVSGGTESCGVGRGRRMCRRKRAKRSAP